MSQNKVYVAIDNGEVKYFISWKDCSRYIEEHGCKIYKGFKSMDEAEEMGPQLLSQQNKQYIAILDNEVYRFNKWSECEAFINKHDHCKFKACLNQEESVNFINANIKKKLNQNIADVLYAYTSASSYRGIRYTLKRNHIEIFSQKYPYVKEEGELYAVRRAVEKALQMNERRVVIVYSFMGVHMWANESWKAKTPEVASYVTWFREISKDIVIDFIPQE